ncbi:MAG: hypothetical protein MJ078_05465 [Clostridia bacterium]|nr:hypothetical protein [Clostridia bacterium]
MDSGRTNAKTYLFLKRAFGKARRICRSIYLACDFGYRSYRKKSNAFRVLPGYEGLKTTAQEYKIVNARKNEETVRDEKGMFCLTDEKGGIYFAERETEGARYAAFELGVCNACAMTTLLNRAALYYCGRDDLPFTFHKVLGTVTAFETVRYVRYEERKSAVADGYRVRLAIPDENNGARTGFIAGDTAPVDRSLYKTADGVCFKAEVTVGKSLAEIRWFLKRHPEGVWVWSPAHAFVITRYERCGRAGKRKYVYYCLDSMRPDAGEIPIENVWDMTPEKAEGKFRVSCLDFRNAD